MEKFTIKGNSDFITVIFEEVFGYPDSTSHFGGYDLRTFIEIKSGNFCVKSSLYTSTGELYEFYQNLKKCNEELTGTANFISYEGNLELIAEYDNLGHVNIKGAFTEQNQYDNELKFEFSSDQTFIKSTVNELGFIADKYGDKKGIKK